MLSKNIILFDPKNIKKSGKWRPLFKAGGGIPGLRVEEKIERSAQTALLKDFEFPFVIIYASDLFWSDIKKAAGYKKVAERILPFFCELHYYRYTGHFLVFIENNQKKNVDIGLLKKELRRYGYTKVLIQVIDTTAQDSSASGRQLSSVISSSLFSKSNEIEWIISDSSTSDLYKSPLAMHTQTEETILSLIEENYEYREKTELLQKNITDLGFYYRALRGETAFKYRPDEPDKQIEITAPPSPQEMIIENTAGSFENTIINNVLPNIKTDYQRYYNENYEQTPVYYKRLGHFLKLITGRRDFLYYMSKKHRQAFLDYLLSMPEDKRIQAWYYYEYEVLPEWYKRVGKFLAKKTGSSNPF